MPVLQLEAQVSTTDLLKAVGQLDMPDLDSFVSQVIDLRARRRAPSLPKREAELLLAISEGLPEDDQRRYDELTAKSLDETLTPKEERSLLSLIKRSEANQARRIELLSELARLRGVSLVTLMADLGIGTPEPISVGDV